MNYHLNPKPYNLKPYYKSLFSSPDPKVSLKVNTQPMGVATYQLSDSLPNNLKEFLTSTEEIEKNLLEFLIKDKNGK